MFRPIRELTKVSLEPAHYRLAHAKIGTLAGRRIPFPAYKGSKASELFPYHVNTATISSRKMPHVRWQHTTTKTEGAKGTHGHWDKIKGGATGGVIGVIGGGLTLKYMYDHPPSKEWAPFIRDIYDAIVTNPRQREINEDYANLRIGREIRNEMSRLKETIQNKGDEFFNKFSEIEKRQNEKDTIISNQKKEIDTLNTQTSDHARQLEKLKNNHKKEIDELTQKHAEEIRKLPITEQAETQEATQAKSMVALYQECLNQKCLIDLHNYFISKGLVEYNMPEPDTTFMDLLGRALQENLNPSVTRLSFRGSVFRQECYRIMDRLKFNNSIKFLNLERSHLEPSDMAAIIRMVESNRTLEEINLQFTRFGNKEADDLMQALRNNNNTSIARGRLDLRGTDVTKDKIEELRKSKPNMTVLGND